MYVAVDGNVVYRRYFDHTSNYEVDNVCGYPGLHYGDEVNVEFSVDIPHTSNSFTIWIAGVLNEGNTNESWGVSDIKIELFLDEEPTPKKAYPVLSKVFFDQNSLVNANDD